MMFEHMVLNRKISHSARETEYELLVYQVRETGEFRIYVAKDGFGVGDIFTASQEIVNDGKSANDADIVEELIAIAIDEIDRNEFDLY